MGTIKHAFTSPVTDSGDPDLVGPDEWNEDHDVTLDASDVGADPAGTAASEVATHTGDTTDAHDASAISFSPTGSISSTDVQAAIAEVASEASGAPADATYLTTTSNGTLSNEVVVGTTPGGELGNTWASPTVDATHSGSSHASIQSAAEATAASALSTHSSDSTSVHGITDTSALALATELLDVIDVRQAPYNVSAGGSASTNATGLQAALDAATDKLVLLPSEGVIDFDTTLTLNQGQRLVGFGTGDTLTNACTLNYTGADTTNAIEMAGTDLSRVWLEGFRLTDGRTSPTSGTGIYLARVKNQVVIQNVMSSGFPTGAFYVGAASGHTTEVVSLKRLWTGSKGVGVTLERVDNQAVLESISGDAMGSATMTALVKVDNILAGQAAVSVKGLKLETNQGCHLLQIGSGFQSVIDGDGLVLRGDTSGAGGDVVHIESTAGVYSFRSLSSLIYAGGAAAAANLINDTADSITYGNGKRLAGVWHKTKATSQLGTQFHSNVARSVKAVSASTTLDPTYDVVLVTAGASNRTMTLPAAASSLGMAYTIKKVDSGVGTVILDGNGSETIDGATTVTLTAQYDEATIVCDASGWHVLQSYTASGVASHNHDEDDLVPDIVSVEEYLAFTTTYSYTTTGTSNDLVVGAVGIVRYGGGGTATLTGISGGTAGRDLIIHNANSAGSNALTLKHQNTGSTTAGDRFALPGGVDLVLDGGMGVRLTYDGTSSRWRPSSSPSYFGTTTPSAVGTAAAGTSAEMSHVDHVHATGAGTPSTQAFGDAAATGSGPAAAMTNHVHGMPSITDSTSTTSSTTAASATAVKTNADALTTHAAAADPHTGYVLESLLDAKGDIIAASADNTPAKVTVGADDTILMADSAQTAGVKWVASQTPSTQAFGDAAAQGTADTYARGDHKHAMPATPTQQYQISFSKSGNLSTSTGAFRWYNDTGKTLTINKVRASVGTAPTTQSILCDVNVDGTTIWTTGPGTNRVAIAAAANTGTQTSFDTTTISDNHYITVDVDQVGSGTVGADLIVTVWMTG